jgi:hypothetical protein
MAATTKTWRHGTPYGYGTKKCRCRGELGGEHPEGCTGAWRDYRRDRERVRQSKKMKTDPAYRAKRQAYIAAYHKAERAELKRLRAEAAKRDAA